MTLREVDTPTLILNLDLIGADVNCRGAVADGVPGFLMLFGLGGTVAATYRRSLCGNFEPRQGNEVTA